MDNEPQYMVPPALIDEIRVNQAELDEIAQRWRKAMEHPRHIELLTPLPRRTRLRLAAERAITGAGIWLGDHVSWGAAEWLWRIADAASRRSEHASTSKRERNGQTSQEGSF